MADALRTTVTFVSPAFNTTTDGPDYINPGNFGDDVAKAVQGELRARGCTVDDEVGQEDHGWYVLFMHDGTQYTFVIGLRPGDGEEEADWVGWMERHAGLLASLFGRRKKGIQPGALTVVDAAIRALPQVSQIRWHRDADFQARREELGTPEP